METKLKPLANQAKPKLKRKLEAEQGKKVNQRWTCQIWHLASSFPWLFMLGTVPWTVVAGCMNLHPSKGPEFKRTYHHIHGLSLVLVACAKPMRNGPRSGAMHGLLFAPPPQLKLHRKHAKNSDPKNHCGQSHSTHCGPGWLVGLVIHMHLANGSTWFLLLFVLNGVGLK